MHPSTLTSLLALREQLANLAPHPWAPIQAWAAKARPLFRAHLGEHLADFENEVKTPRWSEHIMVSGEHRYGNRHDNFAEASAAEEREDTLLATDRKASILAFLDGLIDVVRQGAPAPVAALAEVLKIVDGFERFCRALARRPRSREALVIADEYDVQYLFNALLRASFEDVRPEEPTPSQGGGSARMDFLVKSERLVIELKMTREGLTDREVTDQLLIDIGRYQSHPSCATLFCFVYDPGFLLRNPRAIENDLTKPHGDLGVHVLVRPA